MKIAIISFARKGSKRLRQKNMKSLNGKPLMQYTLDHMQYLNKIGYKSYVLTDWEELELLCVKNYIKVIWRDHPKEWDDIRLNIWAHKRIDADAYVLLQPTSPFYTCPTGASIS